MDLDEPLPRRLPWEQRHTPVRGTRRSRNWKRLIVGERIENKRGELTGGRLLAEPSSGGKGSMSRVRVQCVECDRAYERQLGSIIQGKTRHCRSCAALTRYRKAGATTG